MDKISINKAKKLLLGIPVLVIDDEPSDILNMKDELENLTDEGYITDNVKFFTSHEKYIKECEKHPEAILIADYSMPKNGIDLLDYIANFDTKNEFHLYIYTGQGHDLELKGSSNAFNGKIYNKAVDFSDILIEIQEEISKYKGVTNTSFGSTFRNNIGIDPLWTDIIRLIDKDLKDLSQGNESFVLGGKSYTFAELRKELHNPESSIGRQLIVSHIHGSLMHKDFLNSLK